MKENKKTVTIEIDEFTLDGFKEFQTKRKKALELRAIALERPMTCSDMDVSELLEFKTKLVIAEEDCRTCAVLLCEDILKLIE